MSPLLHDSVILIYNTTREIAYRPAAWPNGYGVRLRIGRLGVRVPSWSNIFLFVCPFQIKKEGMLLEECMLDMCSY